ncbi:MAG: hypothetical protein KDK07_08065 [Bauldia sp.]|nr:hypothetical protein [Bauldia sp.]
MSARHRWGEAERPTRFKTERQCVKCGLVKVTRHENTGGPGETHWTEFWRGLERIECEATPPCQPVEEAAHV